MQAPKRQGTLKFRRIELPTFVSVYCREPLRQASLSVSSPARSIAGICNCPERPKCIYKTLGAYLPQLGIIHTTVVLSQAVAEERIEEQAGQLPRLAAAASLTVF